MTLKNYVFCSLAFMCQFLCAQVKDTIILKEVIVSDASLLKYNKSQSILVLNDSIISKNQATLTNLLNYNSFIYFKEYGRGMLATASFRGTTSAQTAVIWNGINVNSLLTGNADFNTFMAVDFNSISIKSGGGSVSYGSGAIGGTVHLVNNLVFQNNFENDLRLDYGSYNSQGINYKAKISTRKWSSQIGFSRNSSTNDYDYLDLFTWKGVQRKNENGQFSTINMSANVGYKLDSDAILTLYSQTSTTDRNLALTTESDSKTKYINSFSRNLLEYTKSKQGFDSNYKLAYITEKYQYFDDIALPNFSFGQSESLIAKIDLGYQIIETIRLNGIFDYNKTKGFGSSFGNNTRHIGAFALKAIQKLDEKWENELGFRKEISSDYESPFLFAVGSAYSFSPLYTIKFNVSRNFRIPTFNDLYWQPGGNPDLKPESAYQAEIGNVLSHKNFSIKESVYFINIKDLIRWVPGNGNNWSPENTNRVQTYGSETILSWFTSFGKNKLMFDGTYAYTISKNLETNKQLFFVPFHKATGAVSYSYQQFSVNFQQLYNGFVYTRSDNDPNEIIDPYWVSNTGIDYDFQCAKSSKLGFQVLNLWNKKYQSLENRPLPGRNFNLYLILKF
jgi:outer membrane cobalamin receptor